MPQCLCGTQRVPSSAGQQAFLLVVGPNSLCLLALSTREGSCTFSSSFKQQGSLIASFDYNLGHSKQTGRPAQQGRSRGRTRHAHPSPPSPRHTRGRVLPARPHKHLLGPPTPSFTHVCWHLISAQWWQLSGDVSNPPRASGTPLSPQPAPLRLPRANTHHRIMNYPAFSLLQSAPGPLPPRLLELGQQVCT